MAIGIVQANAIKSSNKDRTGKVRWNRIASHDCASEATAIRLKTMKGQCSASRNDTQKRLYQSRLASLRFVSTHVKNRSIRTTAGGLGLGSIVISRRPFVQLSVFSDDQHNSDRHRCDESRNHNKSYCEFAIR